MIEVSHLSKSYRDLKAVDDVSFQVQSGEILGFLGPNGAGKTTTMRILTGVLPPSSGSVKVSGFDVFEQPLEVKKRIGYLPENPPVYTDMTVRAYLRFVASIKGVSRKAREGEVDRVAQKTNCTQFIQRVIGNLSKGQRQRVGLAQALLATPRCSSSTSPRSVSTRPDHRGAAADQVARRQAHHRALDAHPPRGHRHLPEGADHRAGQGGRLRHPGQPAARARRRGDADGQTGPMLRSKDLPQADLCLNSLSKHSAASWRRLRPRPMKNAFAIAKEGA